MKNKDANRVAARPGKGLLVVTLALLLGGAFATTALAQGRAPDPEQMKTRLAERTNEIIELLGLTEEQEPKVREIFAASDEKRAEAFERAFAERSRESMMAMRQQMRELDEANVEALAEILTEAQMGKYKKYLEEQASRRPGGPGGRRGNQ